MLWWQVSEFIRSLPGCEEHGKVFKDEVCKKGQRQESLVEIHIN